MIVLLRRSLGLRAWAGLGPGEPATRRRLAGVGMAGGHGPSDPVEFSGVCVPFWEGLMLRRASRGGCLQELSSGTGKTEILGAASWS